MVRMKPAASHVVLIGDLVASRTSADRQALHDRLGGVLADVDARRPALQPPAVTVGDEFQGVYRRLGEALDASFRIRARLYPLADVRFGSGRGEVQVLDAARGIYDGSAFWAAREAIEEAKARAERPPLQHARTVHREQGGDADLGTAVDAALIGVDELVGSMDPRSRRVLAALLEGATQRDVAHTEGVSASAISQRVRRDGIGAAMQAMTLLGGLA